MMESRLAMLCFLAIFWTAKAIEMCGPCYCQESSGIISCAGMSLRKIPQFSSKTKGFATVLNMRNNFMRSLDIGHIKTFPKLNMLDLRGNNIPCHIIQQVQNLMTVETDCTFATTSEQKLSGPCFNTNSEMRNTLEPHVIDGIDDAQYGVEWVVISAIALTLLVTVIGYMFKSKVNRTLYL